MLSSNRSFKVGEKTSKKLPLKFREECLRLTNRSTHQLVSSYIWQTDVLNLGQWRRENIS